MYDRKGKLIMDCEWINGIESEIDIDYEGDGSEPLNIGIKHLKLTNNCILVDWDVSWLLNLESIEIGDDCFELVQTFKIEGLDRLRSLRIGKNSFTQVKKYDFDIDVEGSHCKCDIKSKSFHILNCESLESIEIGQCSFADFGGEFELKNLINLKSIKIGRIGTTSMNFLFSSFIVRGNTIIMNGLMNV